MLRHLAPLNYVPSSIGQVLSYLIMSFPLLFILPLTPLHHPHHPVISFIFLLFLVTLYSPARHSSSSLSSSSCPAPYGDPSSSFIYHETLLHHDTLHHTTPHHIPPVLIPFYFIPIYTISCTPSIILILPSPTLHIFSPSSLSMNQSTCHTSHHTPHHTPHTASHYFVLQYLGLFSLRLFSFVVCVSHPG